MVMTVMVMVMVIMYDSVAMSSCSWVKMPNTNVLGGEKDGADTYTECQAACVNNAECTGVDWNGAASPGQRCWLAGPWSGQWRIGIVPDIIHYILTRNAGCGMKRTFYDPCGETQTMSHIVESCALTKLNGGLSWLHSVDEDAVSWLTSCG